MNERSRNMERSEVRNAEPAAPLTWRNREHLTQTTRTDNMSSRSIRLPMIVARPGNIGVQIDSFRAVRTPHHPRCGKFTAQFQGVIFEDNSLENYSRVVRRTRARARLLEEKTQKLRQREAQIIADELRRRERRRGLERTNYRRLWQARQATKVHNERVREDQAAVVIQRIARGMIARKSVTRQKAALIEHRAACRLQLWIKSCSRQCRARRQRARETEKERRLHAARVIQLQTRKHQVRKKVRQLSRSASPEREQTPPSNGVSQFLDWGQAGENCEDEPSRIDQDSHDLSHELSLELLLSEVSLASASNNIDEPRVKTPTYYVNICPQRPMAVKRVGGGFRHTNVCARPSRLTASSLANAPGRPHPPRHHHSVGHCPPPRSRLHAGNRPQPLNTHLQKEQPLVLCDSGTTSGEAEDEEDCLLELLDLLDTKSEAI